MTFIGQQRIIRELNYIIPQARDDDVPFNILLSARTGYGKTYLGIQLIQRIGTYQILIEEDAGIITRKIELGGTKANFVDEVHIVRNMELLYPLMDSGRYFLLFATNQAYELPEAFKRRCIPLIFQKYSLDELAMIAKMNLAGFYASDDVLRRIVESCVYSPGNIKVLCLRLRSIFRTQKEITLNGLNDVLINILNIQDGLDPRCREYLEILERVGNISLDNMAHIMGVSRDTVRVDVEPTLLEKDLIRITSKGRSLK